MLNKEFSRNTCSILKYNNFDMPKNYARRSSLKIVKYLFVKIDSNETFSKCHSVYISEGHFVVNFDIEYQNFLVKSKVHSTLDNAFL